MSLRKVCESIRQSSRKLNIYETYAHYLINEVISRNVGSALMKSEHPQAKLVQAYLGAGVRPREKYLQPALKQAETEAAAKAKEDPAAEAKKATKAGAEGWSGSDAVEGNKEGELALRANKAGGKEVVSFQQGGRPVHTPLGDPVSTRAAARKQAAENIRALRASQRNK